MNPSKNLTKKLKRIYPDAFAGTKTPFEVAKMYLSEYGRYFPRPNKPKKLGPDSTFIDQIIHYIERRD